MASRADCQSSYRFNSVGQVGEDSKRLKCFFQSLIKMGQNAMIFDRNREFCKRKEGGEVWPQTVLPKRANGHALLIPGRR
jgi:hypothetical protein